MVLLLVLCFSPHWLGTHVAVSRIKQPSIMVWKVAGIEILSTFRYCRCHRYMHHLCLCSSCYTAIMLLLQLLCELLLLIPLLNSFVLLLLSYLAVLLSKFLLYVGICAADTYSTTKQPCYITVFLFRVVLFSKTLSYVDIDTI